MTHTQCNIEGNSASYGGGVCCETCIVRHVSSGGDRSRIEKNFATKSHHYHLSDEADQGGRGGGVFASPYNHIDIGVQPADSRSSVSGFHVTENPMHVNDFHATLLHLLGLDHEALTYSYQGRNFRLTDVAGKVATELIA